MRKNSKRIFLSSVLLCLLLFLSLPNSNLVFAAGNPVAAEAETKEKEKAENTGNVAEPPSGPNVKIDTVEEKVEIETPASVTGQKIEGTGTVTDFSTSGSKAFYTITDKEHNVFYLIIDLDKTDNNVYFLSDINKSDLEGLPIPEENVTPMPEQQLESVQAQEPQGSGNGFLIMVLLLAAIGVAAYYFLVMKKRQGQGNTENEDEEDMMGSYEDDMLDVESNKKG